MNHTRVKGYGFKKEYGIVPVVLLLERGIPISKTTVNTHIKLFDLVDTHPNLNLL